MSWMTPCGDFNYPHIKLDMKLVSDKKTFIQIQWYEGRIEKSGLG